jgi:rhodanese-related sulfurtransferase
VNTINNQQGEIMKLKIYATLLLTAALLFNGCAKVGESGQATLSTPAPAVQQLIDEHKLEVVDYDYARKAIGNGTRGGASALFIDARPNKKYLQATIPSSINLPDTQIDQYIGQLDAVAKDREIIVFCGGWKCEKSPIVAGYLKDKGYTDVKLYQAGEPEWAARNYIEVGIPVVKNALENDSAVIMDARPRKKFLKETIPGSMSMYDQELDRLSGRFPADKTTPVITFCGGYECEKSHLVANRLMEMGYSNVSVFAAGLPGWKKAEMATTASGAKAPKVAAAPAEAQFVAGIKLGEDEGTVDGEWLNSLIAAGNVPDNLVIVDVRGPEDFASGHLKGAINIKAGNIDAAQLAAKLPNDKVSVFACGSGARAMEAFFKLKDGKQDVSKVMYFDANISCKADNNCMIEVNEPLGL